MAKRSDRSSGTRRARWLAIPGMLLLALPLLVPAARAQGTYTQTFELRPGWNAIYLEVQPDPSEIGAAFAGVPIASVWTYDARFGGKVTGIVDPARGLIDSTGWYGFFAPGRPESALTNLFHLRVNRAYLVKLEGPVPVQWVVTGKPSLRQVRWEPDSFNLVGFPVDPQNPPSFGSWFEPSPAHAGQAVYRLDPAGIWQPVLPYFEPIRSGEAYWVYTRGASSYQGPLEVELELSDRLEFGVAGEQSTLTIRNRRDLNTTLAMKMLASSAPLALKYQAVDAQTARRSWDPVPATLLVPVPAGEIALVTLAPSRADFVAQQVEQILEISDGLGSRLRIVASASSVESTAPGGGGGAALEDTEIHSFAGLWVGSASVNRVGEARCQPLPRTGCACLPKEANSRPDPRDAPECSTDSDGDGDPDANCAQDEFCRCDPPQCVQTVPTALLTPTGSAFDLRLIVYVNGSGGPTLLKEVIQLVHPPGMIPHPEDPSFRTVDPNDPGETVLVTDDARIHQFQGGAMRDGVPVGVRIATAAYDFDEQTPGWNATTHGLPMEGGFGPNATLTANIVLGPNLPTHPFRHKYHPDHGDDASDPPTITRAITLLLRPNWGWCDESRTVACSLHSECGEGGTCQTDFLEGLIPAPPGWGAETVGGTYRETITGLHRDALTVEGVVLLTRAARTTKINSAD